MKIEIKETASKPSEIKFPVVMVSHTDERHKFKIVVLFHNESSGTILYDSSNEWKIGSFQTLLPKCSNSYVWKKFEGTITISSDE